MTEETQVPETPETPKKPTNKKAIAIISCALAVVLIGVGVGGYIALKGQQNREAFEAMKTATRSGWRVDAPAYMNGSLSSSAYYAGPGLDCDVDDLAGCKMQIISNTTRADYDAYLVKLDANDYDLVAKNTIGNSVFASYEKNGSIVYAYHVGEANRSQVIVDKVSATETEFEYSYTPTADDTTSFYQYAIANDPFGTSSASQSASNGAYNDCGMFYVIKLADDSVILIDGGSPGSQASEQSTAGLVDFLYEITGKNKANEDKIRVAFAFISHAHRDHYGFIHNLARDYTENFEFERFAFNFPKFINKEYKTIGTMFKTNYPNAKYMKLHTGQSLKIANSTIDVITTHEDLVNTISGYTTIGDFNYSSTMLKITLNNKSFFMMADWGGSDSEEVEKTVEPVLDIYRENDAYPFFKSDFVQVGHHGLNELSVLLDKIQATTALIPQADTDWYGYKGGWTDPITNLRVVKAPTFTRTVDDVIAAGATEVYFQSRNTYGFTIATNGTVTKSQEAIRGVTNEYLTMLSNYRPFVMPSANK